MIYIATDTTNIVTFIHYMPFDPRYGLGKSEEELKKTGFLVESIPEYGEEVPEGKYPELHYDGSKFSWVLVDVPDGPEQPADLEQRIVALEKVQNAQLGLEE